MSDPLWFTSNTNIQIWGPQHGRTWICLSKSKGVPWKQWVIEHFFYKEWLSQLGLFIPDKTRLQGDLIAMFQDLKVAFKNNMDSLFNRACSNRTGGNSYILKRGKFRLDRRKKLFMRSIGLGTGCPKRWYMPQPENSWCWTGSWAAWSGGRLPCLLQGFWTRWAFEPKSFCDSINILSDLRWDLGLRLVATPFLSVWDKSVSTKVFNEY